MDAVHFQTTTPGDTPVTSAAPLPVTLGSSTVTVDTELPAAAALAEGSATPTTPKVGVNLLVYNGATWDFAYNAAGTSTKALRTTLASDDPAVVALQIMDDWDETNRAAVNIIAGQVGAQGGSGVVTALTLRAVLATDIALPAGTNAIGKLAPNSGVDIGDVDVTSVVPGTGATNLGKAEDGGHTSGDVGVMSLGVRSDTLADQEFAGADLDYSPLATDSTSRLITVPRPLSPWKLHETPAANTQATEEQASAGTGLKNVLRSVSFVLSANTTAPAAAVVEVYVRDGAAGAGTIIWQHTITLPATAGAMNGIAITDLWIEGTAATAMSVEFSAAGGANTFESLSATGEVIR